jgi:hypothetical protein
MAKESPIASIFSSDNTNAISLQSIASLNRCPRITQPSKAVDFSMSQTVVRSLNIRHRELESKSKRSSSCAFQTIEEEPGGEMVKAKPHFSLWTVVIRGITLQADDSQGDYFTTLSSNHGGCCLWGLR